MPRADIWKDGIKTRFSKDQQPANRGRKKGRPNRATICRKAFEFFTLLEQQQRDQRNTQRRERYRMQKERGKKMGRGNHPPDPNEPGEPPARL